MLILALTIEDRLSHCPFSEIADTLRYNPPSAVPLVHTVFSMPMKTLFKVAGAGLIAAYPGVIQAHKKKSR